MDFGLESASALRRTWAGLLACILDYAQGVDDAPDEVVTLYVEPPPTPPRAAEQRAGGLCEDS